MGKINRFNKHYTEYERGYMNDEEFGLGQYFSGKYIRDMKHIISDCLKELDLEDLSTIDEFYDRFGGSEFDERYFADDINKSEKVYMLPDAIVNSIIEDLDIFQLVEHNKILLNQLIQKADLDEWADLVWDFPKKLYECGVRSSHLWAVYNKFHLQDTDDFLEGVAAASNSLSEWLEMPELELLLRFRGYL